MARYEIYDEFFDNALHSHYHGGDTINFVFRSWKELMVKVDAYKDHFNRLTGLKLSRNDFINLTIMTLFNQKQNPNDDEKFYTAKNGEDFTKWAKENGDRLQLIVMKKLFEEQNKPKR